MFDVDWSDPHRESVGDRRARKQKQKEISDRASNKDNADKDSKRDEQSSQASGSGSVRSSMSSVDKQFGFFGGKSRKKGRSLGNSKSAASSTTGAPTIHELEPTEENDNDNNIVVKSPTEASSGVPQDSEAAESGDNHSGPPEKSQGSKLSPYRTIRNSRPTQPDLCLPFGCTYRTPLRNHLPSTITSCSRSASSKTLTTL